MSRGRHTSETFEATHTDEEWPSFWQPLSKAVVERQDGTLGMTRMAVHCRRCGGYLGHVFDDGPKPTGLR